MAQTEVKFRCPCCGGGVHQLVRAGVQGLQTSFCFDCQKEVAFRLEWEAKATPYKLTKGKS